MGESGRDGEREEGEMSGSGNEGEGERRLLKESVTDRERKGEGDGLKERGREKGENKRDSVRDIERKREREISRFILNGGVNPGERMKNVSGLPQKQKQRG